MKRSSWIILAVIVVLMVVQICIKLSAPSDISDEDQIRALLETAQNAVQNRSARTAMDCVSKNYSDAAGNTYTTLRVLARKGMRTPVNLHVDMVTSSVEIHEKTAAVETNITVSSQYRENEPQEVFSHHVKIALTKESYRRWLFFSAYKWKISSISGLPGALDW